MDKQDRQTNKHDRLPYRRRRQYITNLDNSQDIVTGNALHVQLKNRTK